MTNMKSKIIGGTGGTGWNDDSAMKAPVTRVQIRHARWIDAIEVTYGQFQAPIHGGDGGTASEFVLTEGEKIIAVVGSYAQYIDQLTFVVATPDGYLKKYGPFGGQGGTSRFCIMGEVQGFLGRSGTYLDALGVWTKGDPIIFEM